MYRPKDLPQVSSNVEAAQGYVQTLRMLEDARQDLSYAQSEREELTSRSDKIANTKRQNEIESDIGRLKQHCAGFEKDYGFAAPVYPSDFLQTLQCNIQRNIDDNRQVLAKKKEELVNSSNVANTLQWVSDDLVIAEWNIQYWTMTLNIIQSNADDFVNMYTALVDFYGEQLNQLLIRGGHSTNPFSNAIVDVKREQLQNFIQWDYPYIILEVETAYAHIRTYELIESESE